MNFEVILFALILVARQIACFNRARYHEKMYLDKVENSWLVNGKISIIKYCRYDGIHPGGKRSYTQVDYNVPYKSLAGTNFKVDSHKMFFLHFTFNLAHMAKARKQGKPTDYMFMDEPEKEPTILDSPFNGQMA